MGQSLLDLATKLLLRRTSDGAFIDDGLPDIEPADPAEVPPDEGDIGHAEEN